VPETEDRGRRRRAPRPLAAALALTALAVIGAAPAGATTPPLNALIVNNPEPGWQSAPAPVLEAIVQQLQKVDANAASGQPVQVAARVWASPEGNQLMAVTLSLWPGSVDLGQLARASVGDECLSVTGNNPSAVGTDPAIPGSLQAACGQPGAMNRVAVVVAHQGPYMELVESISTGGATPAGLGALDLVAAQQAAQLPAVGSVSLALVVGLALGGAGVLALVLFAVVRWRHRRRALDVSAWPMTFAAPAPLATWTPPRRARPAYSLSRMGPVTTLPSFWQFLEGGPGTAGSSPDGRQMPPGVGTVGWQHFGDPRRMRYWDGRNWTAEVVWNGSAWVR
jgi:hypothetical protein